MLPINDEELETLRRFAVGRGEDHHDVVLFAGTLRLLCEEVQQYRGYRKQSRCDACWRSMPVTGDVLCPKCSAYYGARETR